jgi:hypothetical protein
MRLSSSCVSYIFPALIVAAYTQFVFKPFSESVPASVSQFSFPLALVDLAGIACWFIYLFTLVIYMDKCVSTISSANTVHDVNFPFFITVVNVDFAGMNNDIRLT